MNHGDHGDHGDIVLLPDDFRQKEKLDLIADKILDSAFKLHRQYGPGLLESAYEAILVYELLNQKLTVEKQKTLPIIHENLKIEAGYRIDLLVGNEVIIELKACEKILPVHEAQILTYLKLSGKRLGIILNFNARMMKDGIRRFML